MAFVVDLLITLDDAKASFEYPGITFVQDFAIQLHLQISGDKFPQLTTSLATSLGKDLKFYIRLFWCTACCLGFRMTFDFRGLHAMLLIMTVDWINCFSPLSVSSSVADFPIEAP